ncbi:MAG TPA: hypothetical protein VMS89_02510 [Methanoregulaceae archaeon]|nr:hypothetical protein [Methanoregulaceae archaeon]
MDLYKKNPSGRVLNDEFQKRASDLQLMVSHMKGRADLIKKIGSEPVIPEQTRDMAIKAISCELKENLLFFFQFLINFINLGMQGLHHVDFEVGFTFFGNGIVQTDCCILHVDGKQLEIPLEIGTRYILAMFGSSDQQNPDFIEAYYKMEEAYYDRALGEVSGRCNLRVLEELFPKRCIHVTMKLPAQVIIKNQISL